MAPPPQELDGNPSIFSVWQAAFDFRIRIDFMRIQIQWMRIRIQILK
jgi:hypothetical protein